MVDRALELAYEEGTRTLAEQQTSRESAVSRTSIVFAVAAIGTGFLADPAMKDHKGTPWQAWVAIVALVATVGAVISVVWPRQWRWTLSPGWFVGKEGTDQETLYRYVGNHLETYINDNDASLDTVWRSVRWAFAFAGASLVAWLLLLAGVWTK